jgi:hypothetical protein
VYPIRLLPPSVLGAYFFGHHFREISSFGQKRYICTHTNYYVRRSPATGHLFYSKVIYFHLAAQVRTDGLKTEDTTLGSLPLPRTLRSFSELSHFALIHFRFRKSSFRSSNSFDSRLFVALLSSLHSGDYRPPTVPLHSTPPFFVLLTREEGSIMYE